VSDIAATIPLEVEAARPRSERGVAVRAPGAIEIYRQDFDRQPAAPRWLQSLREHGFARFEALGFPTTKNEDWHFTSVAPISEQPFTLASLTDATAATGSERREAPRRKADAFGQLGVRPADVEGFGFGESGWHTLVFVNGAYSPELSSADGEVVAGSLAHAIEAGNPAVERYLGRIATFDQHAFTALNTAFVEDGAFIEILPEAVVELPIHLVFVSEGDTVSHPRNLIVAGRHSRATVVETYVSLRDGTYFTNAVTEVVVGEGAHLDHYKIQRESELAFHVGTVQAKQEANSQFHSFSFAVGGSLARTTSTPPSMAMRRLARSTAFISRTARSTSTTRRASSTSRPTARATRFTRASSTAARTGFSMARFTFTPRRRRPTASRATTICCYPRKRVSTPSPSSRFSPTM